MRALHWLQNFGHFIPASTLPPAFASFHSPLHFVMRSRAAIWAALGSFLGVVSIAAKAGNAQESASAPAIVERRMLSIMGLSRNGRRWNRLFYSFQRNTITFKRRNPLKCSVHRFRFEGFASGDGPLCAKRGCLAENFG